MHDSLLQEAAVRHLGQHRQRRQQDGVNRGDGQDSGLSLILRYFFLSVMWLEAGGEVNVSKLNIPAGYREGEALSLQSAGLLLCLQREHHGEGEGSPPHLLD